MQSRHRKPKSDNTPLKKWLIFPDYWKKSWGRKPCLGVVRAVTEFEAERKAYDLKLLRVNLTFGPKAFPVNGRRKRFNRPSAH